jgi:hypothetical protein
MKYPAGENRTPSENIGPSTRSAPSAPSHFPVSAGFQKSKEKPQAESRLDSPTDSAEKPKNHDPRQQVDKLWSLKTENKIVNGSDSSRERTKPINTTMAGAKHEGDGSWKLKLTL